MAQGEMACMSERSVSLRLLRLLAWILSYRDVIVALACAEVIFTALDTSAAVTIAVYFLIGWFVPRNET